MLTVGQGIHRMGLASQFGGDDAAYQCGQCGTKVALYTPCCPKCLNKTLTPVKKVEKAQPGFQRANQGDREAKKTASPVAGLLIIVAIAAGVYFMVSQPKPEAVTRPDPGPTVTTRPQARPRVTQKRIKRPTVSKAPAGSTASSTPKPVKQMKLWEATSDDVGE